MWRYCISKNWGIQKCHHEWRLGVNLVIDNIVYVASDTASVYNLNAIGSLLMEILHFEDLGDTECRLAANAVVLVIGEQQISIATTSGGYLPSCKI